MTQGTLDVLKLEQVSVYRGHTPVIRNVTFSLGPGELVLLFGRNGSGRTTLLEGLSGLHRRDGRVDVGGATVSSLAPAETLSKGLALCPEGRGLFPDMSVSDNLFLGGYILPARVARARAKALMESLPLLAERSLQNAGTMSGGEQQLLAAARACVTSPKVLLLDHCSTGLSPRYRDAVVSLMREVAASGGAVLMAEDDLAFSLGIVTRVLVLSGGSLAFELPGGQGLTPSALNERLLQQENRSGNPATA